MRCLDNNSFQREISAQVGAGNVVVADADAVVAVVDTVPPGISEVDTDPAYNEATITWSTDKPADALIRFNLTLLRCRRDIGMLSLIDAR